MSDLSLKDRISRLTPQQRAALAKKLAQRPVDRDSTSEHAGTIPHAPRDGLLPLSFAQERLWFLDQLSPGLIAYNMPAALRLTGPLDREALTAAFAAIVARHEALRTRFVPHDAGPEDGRATQAIEPPGPWDLPLEDLTHLPPEEREPAARARAVAEAETPFDLARAPLLRTRLLRLAPDDHVLLATLHHIASDGWSLGVLVGELSRLYAAFAAGLPDPLPPLACQYADFAVWQRQTLAGPAFDRALGYWRNQLDALETLALPTDRPRPATQSHRGAVATRVLPAHLAQGLNSLARQNRASLFMTLLAAFQILLARWSGQTDITVGSPIANRTHTDLEPLIGFFVNSLALRTDLAGNPTFSELLKRVRQTALAAYQNQDIPFERIVEEIAPTRQTNKHPIFQHAFALQNTPSASVDLSSLSLQKFDMQVTTTRMDMEWHVWEQPAGLNLVICYATDLFDPATIGLLMAHFATLLESIVANPEQPVSALRLAALANPHRTTAPIAPITAAGLFEIQAASRPAAAALILGDNRLTYGETDKAANRLAHWLVAQGVGPEIRVALCLPRSVELIVALLAVWKANGGYVPLDPDYPEERLTYMLADSQPTVLITQSDIALRLGFGGVSLCIDRSEAMLSALPITPPARRAGPDNLAYIIYTSGSTGRPKGAAVPHSAIVNLTAGLVPLAGLRDDERMLLFSSVSFDASIGDFAVSIFAGPALVLVDGPTSGSPDAVANLMRREKVTMMAGVPALLQLVPDPLPDLRIVMAGGEPFPVAMARRLGPGRHLMNVYGPTEATCIATVNPAFASTIDQTPSIGEPLPNVGIVLLDRWLRPVPDGVPGEICIAGAGLARGYWERPAETAENFIPHPCPSVPGERLYRTGDLGRRGADGSLHFLGRIDRQAKLRGFRIELGEIEAALGRHPRIAAAAVVLDNVVRPAETANDIATGPAIDRPDGGTLELWPSIAEHFVYDETLYYAMTHDEARNAHYRAALAEHAPGRVVLDVGTGADAILARLAAEAGARHVYAVEYLEKSYRSARDTVARLGLTDRITVLHGDARTVVLPEPAELCVSEIVGPIGGAEGSAAILNTVWRLLAPSARMIPARTESVIAAVSLPGALVANPHFTPLTADYVRRIFANAGQPFDLRLCIKGLRRDDLVSDIAPFEVLDHCGPVTMEGEHRIALTVTRDTILHGLLVWLRLFTTPDRCLDTLDVNCCWLPVLMPAFGDGLEATAGTMIEATIIRSLAPNGLNPDFQIAGCIRDPGGSARNFAWASPHGGTIFQGSPFYRRLFGGNLETSDDKRLIAYVVPRQGDAEPALAEGHIADWRMLYEASVPEFSPGDDPGFAVANWNSSYTGQPIPRDEMREWRDRTVERIRLLEPRRIWEIGCGSGLLLWPLAPDVEAYRGGDFSQSTITALADRVAAAGFNHVEVETREAADTDGIPQGRYDTAILNSIIQYLPGRAYLDRVLTGVADKLPVGGRLFIGDVRSLPWLPAFHASVTTLQNGTAEQARKALADENELALDPGYFTTLSAPIPRLRHTEICLKRGHGTNEMARFRYDVLLFLDEIPTSVAIERIVDWQSEDCNLDSLAAMLESREQTAIEFRNIPNQRIMPDIEAAVALGLQTLPIFTAPTVDPEALWQLAERLGYTARVAPSLSGDPATMDALFERSGSGDKLRAWRRDRPVVAQHLANDPLRTRQQRALLAELRPFLRRWLPDHMVPAIFMQLETLPLSPTGKLDRRALPPPERPAALSAAVPPTDRLEAELVQLWQEFLGVSPIGTTDNFFNLGGHSLLAVRLVARVKEQFGKNVPLSSLMTDGTIRGMAEALRADDRHAGNSPLVLLRAGGELAPIYCVHPGGGSMLCYWQLAQQLDHKRPVIGIQARGLEPGEEPHETVEAMAEYYVAAIRRAQPKGPYHLAGWSFGGHIAFEIACRLKAGNAEVGLLALLDAYPPAQIPKVEERYMQPAAFLAYLAQLAGLDIDVAELEGLDENAQIETVAARAAAQGILPHGAGSGFVRRILKLCRISGRLARTYQPRPYDGRIDFYRAAEAMTDALADLPSHDPTLGWGPFGSPEIVEVPGGHGTMIFEPHVTALASALNRRLSDEP